MYIYTSGFDLCKMAEAAFEMSYYDSAVIFYKFCIQKLTNCEAKNKTIAGVFKKTRLSSLTSKKIKVFREKAIKTHDKMLKDFGQLGRFHRCSSTPFSQKSYRASDRLPLISNNTLASSEKYMWYDNINRPLLVQPALQTRDIMMCDTLCRGGKVKVLVQSLHTLSNNFTYNDVPILR